MKSFAAFLAYFQVGLATIMGVRQMENIDPTTPGQVKADLVLNVVGTAAAATPAIADAISTKDIAATITATSTAAVSILNAAGIFKHQG